MSSKRGRVRELNLKSTLADGSKRGTAAAEKEAGGRGMRGNGFLLLRAISYFTYEMVNNQSETAREGGFRERRTGCPLLPARPVECHTSISLVKSDWKLQQKTIPPHPPPASLFFRSRSSPFASVRQRTFLFLPAPRMPPTPSPTRHKKV